jgi:hypothetical protein
MHEWTNDVVDHDETARWVADFTREDGINRQSRKELIDSQKWLVKDHIHGAMPMPIADPACNAHIGALCLLPRLHSSSLQGAYAAM